MKKILVIISTLALCVLLALAAGCTQPVTTTGSSTPTMAVTTAPATPPPTSPAVFSTPGPTQTLPSYWDIEVEVESNGYAPDPKIVTTVRGGQGLTYILQIDVKVTRTDGIVENGIIPSPLEIGNSVALNGTDKNHDRAEVWATDPHGTKVIIFVDYVPFSSYN